MKKIIATSWATRTLNENKLCRAILQYRNTPSRRDGLSPAQKLYGRPIQDTLPAHRRSFALEWQHNFQETEDRAAHTLQQSELFYNTHAHALPDIKLGSSVALQNPQTKLWDIYGTIVQVGPHRRYYIKTQSGRVLTRNRRFLRYRNPASLNINGTAQPPSPMQEPTTTHIPTRSSGVKQPCKTIRASPQANQKTY